MWTECRLAEFWILRLRCDASSHRLHHRLQILSHGQTYMKSCVIFNGHIMENGMEIIASGIYRIRRYRCSYHLPATHHIITYPSLISSCFITLAKGYRPKPEFLNAANAAKT